MVGKLRALLGRVIGAEGSRVVCSLLLASTLLTGCGGTSASSTANSAANGVASQSKFGSTLTRGVSTSTSTGSTTSSTPAATDKSIDVTWSAPTANTNGSALTDLAGYTIYYGTSPTQLTRSVKVASAGATDYVVQGLSGGTWYFAVTAYTSAGLQSTYSTIVSRTIT
jgi:hypothetical protein